jgi:hypothetical protein
MKDVVDLGVASATQGAIATPVGATSASTTFLLLRFDGEELLFFFEGSFPSAETASFYLLPLIRRLQLLRHQSPLGVGCCR